MNYIASNCEVTIQTSLNNVYLRLFILQPLEESKTLYLPQQDAYYRLLIFYKHDDPPVLFVFQK